MIIRDSFFILKSQIMLVFGLKLSSTFYITINGQLIFTTKHLLVRTYLDGSVMWIFPVMGSSLGICSKCSIIVHQIVATCCRLPRVTTLLHSCFCLFLPRGSPCFSELTTDEIRLLHKLPTKTHMYFFSSYSLTVKSE